MAGTGERLLLIAKRSFDSLVVSTKNVRRMIPIDASYVNFVSFYSQHVFNDHWGDVARMNPSNTLVIRMTSYALDAGQSQKVWQPFLD